MRTIGDNHMVASEMSRPRPDHAQALAYLALEMRAYLESIPGNGRQISWLSEGWVLNASPTHTSFVRSKRRVFISMKR